MLTINDLCPGYRDDHLGLSGRCCCGLHWDGHMPPHLRTGELIAPHVLERLRRRDLDGAEVDYRRRLEKRARRAAELAARDAAAMSVRLVRRGRR